MSIKKIIRIVTLTGVGAFLLYCAGFFIINPVYPEYKDCGKVISKSQDEISIKYGVQTMLYLNIQFEKSGFKSVDVCPTTYFKSKIGDNLCFNLNEEVTGWYLVRSCIGAMVLAVLGIVFVFFFIGYLIED
jgi:hypothetical protein